jgi:hypothetical protein
MNPSAHPFGCNQTVARRLFATPSDMSVPDTSVPETKQELEIVCCRGCDCDDSCPFLGSQERLGITTGVLGPGTHSCEPLPGFGQYPHRILVSRHNQSTREPEPVKTTSSKGHTHESPIPTVRLMPPTRDHDRSAALHDLIASGDEKDTDVVLRYKIQLRHSNTIVCENVARTMRQHMAIIETEYDHAGVVSFVRTCSNAKRCLRLCFRRQTY